MSSYGALKESSNSEEDGIFVPSPEEPKAKSFGLMAAKTAGTVLVFAGLSVLAVTASKSFTSSSSRGASFEETTAVTGAVTYSLLSDTQKLDLFTTFITDYNRDYAQDADEYNKRLVVFKANLDIADERNAKEATAGGSAVHGVTKFSDLTSEEFMSTYLMSTTTDDSSTRRRALREKALKVTAANDAKLNTRAQAAVTMDMDKLKRSLSDPTIMYVDWSSSYASAVKNTGSCAGSWATAAAEQIESDAIIAGIITTTEDLSAQQILSCTPKQDGCTSGDISAAYDYVTKPGGIFKAKDYQYTASTGTVDACDEPDEPYALTLGSAFNLNTDNISDNTEKLMIERLTNKGTLSVCVDATIWSTYVSGTMANCDGNVINHCVQVVGAYFSSAEDSGFYKIRNSWGTDWGIDGYVSVAYGSNVCAVANNPMYTDAVKSGRK